MKAKDTRRKWMWLLLGVVAALQLYFVRELLAAFALFALGFAGIAICLASLYLLQKGWESGVARLGGESELLGFGGTPRDGCL